MSTLSPEPEKLLIGLHEAARLLSISGRHLWQLVRDGEVPFVRLRGRLLFSPETLRQWIIERARRQVDPQNGAKL